MSIITFMTAHHLSLTCTKLILSTLYQECSSSVLSWSPE
jgi:hypothetical protein